LVARTHGHDVMAEGSGNPGASNVARLAGWRAGATVLALDISKGAAAAGLGYAVHGRPGAYALGIAATIGHVLPATRRFRGGKGVATAGGALIVLYPLIALALAAAWLIVARVFKKASIGSLVLCISFPLLVWAFGYATWEIVTVSALAALVLARHASNLRRLVHGQENSLDGATRRKPEPEK
jgi:glycerol-3-phosphate acyltransferase PlsY